MAPTGQAQGDRQAAKNAARIAVPAPDPQDRARYLAFLRALARDAARLELARQTTDADAPDLLNEA